MRNVRNLRKSFMLAACLAAAAACSSSSPRWTDTNGTDPSNDPSRTQGADAGGPTGDDSTPPGTPPPPPPAGDDASTPDDGGDVIIDPTVDAAIYATPSTCTSGTHWTNGDHGSADMQPGSACRTCHVIGGSASGKTWDIAGTVYPTAHEPDDCNGAGPSGVSIVITDKNGVQTSIGVSSSGNFYHADLFGFGKIPTPYTAKVVYGGKERKMMTPQTEGDCNSCHTETGTKSAPGRIMLP